MDLEKVMVGGRGGGRAKGGDLEKRERGTEHGSREEEGREGDGTAERREEHGSREEEGGRAEEMGGEGAEKPREWLC